MSDERLLCECGDEGKVVRIDAGTLAFGHINGGRAGHRFRLARSGQAPANVRGGSNPGRTEGPARGVPASPDLTTNGTRAASKGSPRTAIPSGASSNPSIGADARRGPLAAERRSPERPPRASAPMGGLPTAAGRG